MDFIEENGYYRIFSLQSEEVVNNLLRTGLHKADLNKSRERRDYIEDIKQLNGENPIWGIALYPELKTELLFNGTFLSMFGIEMSLGTRGLDGFLMLEILIPKDKLKVGITHNSSKYSVVFPEVKLENVVAIWKVYNVGVKSSTGFFEFGYHLKSLHTSDKVSLFSNGFTTLSLDDTYYELTDPDEFLINNPSYVNKKPLENLSDIQKTVYKYTKGIKEPIGIVNSGTISLTESSTTAISTNPLD